MGREDQETGKKSTEIAMVPFHDGHILVAGEQVIIKPLCEMLGVDFSSQRKRIMRESRWKNSVVKMAIELAGSQGERRHLTLHRRRLAAFVYGIQAGMVKDPKVRANLEAYQDEIDDVIDAYFTARVSGAQRKDAAALQRQVDALTAELERERAVRLLTPPPILGTGRARHLTARLALLVDLELGVACKEDRQTKTWRTIRGQWLQEAWEQTFQKGSPVAWRLLTGDQALLIQQWLGRKEGAVKRAQKRRGKAEQIRIYEQRLSELSAEHLRGLQRAARQMDLFH